LGWDLAFIDLNPANKVAPVGAGCQGVETLHGYKVTMLHGLNRSKGQKSKRIVQIPTPFNLLNPFNVLTFLTLQRCNFVTM
jgi:hypothetical protein